MSVNSGIHSSQAQLVDLEFASERRVFVRMEEAKPLLFMVTNRLQHPLTGARALFSLQGGGEREIAIPELASGESHTLEFPLDTRLRPGVYRLKVGVEVGDTPGACEEEFSLTLVPRALPHRMPVVMWGANPGEVQRLKDMGFTHCAGLAVDNARIWKAGEPTEAGDPEAVARTRKALDQALAEDLGVYAYVAPGRWARSQEEYRRVGRDGKHNSDDICGLYPRLREFCYQVGVSVARTYGDFPAFDTALLHTEVRGESQVCFHEHDQAAFRQFAGYDIPEEVLDKNGTPYQELKDFPADRVIPDDYPLYVYYQWLWKQGDGWNDLHTAVHQGLQAAGRPDLWTWYDPAVRVASVWGSGGEVDVISQWTYSYPDPIRIGMATDELFAMARGRPGQQVMKMTQIIWYRSQTAPEAGEEATAQKGDFQDQDEKVAGSGDPEFLGYQAQWEQEQPEARFITIPPIHLREAFWTKLSRPVQGIMYHGWESLVENDKMGAYRYTHPETRHELRRLVKTVLEPLGPALMQVPDGPGEVAFLESFAAQMLAGRGTYGWNGGWAGDAYLILLYAQLQPEIVYDETILEKGLEGFKVLVLADCDVLTETVARKVQAFQDCGGILIGDDRLCPAIQPDILIPSFERPKQADAARAQLQTAAAELRQKLDPRYGCYAESTNPDVITRRRCYGKADYLFAINDRREYGEYVGHHSLVMENGLPSDAKLVVHRAKGFAYDLVRGRQVEPAFVNDQLEISAHFGPGEGRVYLITDRPIDGVQVEAPETARRGDSVEVGIAVVDEDGRPIDAVVPVKVEFLDPDSRAAEFSGYYGARDGQLRIRLDLAANEVPGLWRIQVEELASGRTAAAYMRVTEVGR